MTLLIEGYFDESGSHAGAEALCVAGYAFEKSHAVALSEEWNAILERRGLPYFRMSQCAHGNGPFKNLSKGARIETASNMMGLIRRHGLYGFAVSVDIAAYRELMPEHEQLGVPYSFCARSCLDAVYKWLFKLRYVGDVAYFFEAGHESRAQADRIITETLTNPFKHQRWRYAGHSFVPKDQAPPVQAADVLAWQWATDLKHQATGRPRRKDLESLLFLPHHCFHFSRQRLIDHIAVLREFGVWTDKSNYKPADWVKLIRKIEKKGNRALAR